MATTTLTLLAERWLDEVLLGATVADAAGATIAESFLLPVGLGDVALMSIQIVIPVVATVPVAATAPRGATGQLLSSDTSTQVDYVGTSEFIAIGGNGATFDRFACFIDPDALMLWRQGEILLVRGPEMDANAAPTGDVSVAIKCVRVRPLEAGTAGPIRLVR